MAQTMQPEVIAPAASRRYDPLKRVLDIVAAAAGLMLCAPLIVGLAILIRLDSPGGPLFRQIRIGRGGRPFTLYKLRTFHRHAHGFYGDEEIRWHDPRITRVGGWLRRTKLDELPQLLNVLAGHMSLVGPRPSMPEQVARYNAPERVRLGVRPGLTGIVQVSGNTFVTWPERIRMDRWYVCHRSLRLDLALLRHTLPVVLRGERAGDDPFGLRVPGDEDPRVDSGQAARAGGARVPP